MSPTAAEKDRIDYRALKQLDRVWTYTLLVIGILVTIVPFVWMLSTSFKPEAEVFLFPPHLLPVEPTLKAYATLFNKIEFGRTFLNSAIVTLLYTFINMLVASLAGYAFAKIRFLGRDKIFVLFLITLMIPSQVTMIPSFIVLKQLGLLNSYWGLIIPGSASVLGIFLVRQFMYGVPDDLLDAARIDGCNELQIYWHLILPLLKPVLSTVAIFSFMGAWNDFLWPMIVLSSQDMYTLPVALAMLNGEHNTEWALLMAGAVVVTLPILAVFFSLQRHFIEGVTHSGLKG